MSLRLQEAVSLKPFNTFGVDVRGRLFAEAHSDAEVREALALAEQRGLPLLPVGGGSNLLLTADIPALVLRMASRGIRVISDDGSRVVIEAEAGEPWHPFVQHTLAQGFSGLENLSLIPGTVGAAPMQNIGAYGVEIKDVFAGLTALDRQTGELRDFTLEECNFAYRAGFLHDFVAWGPCWLEDTECLEQLRALWHGVRIHVADALEAPAAGVDTPEDLERVRRLLGA